MKYFALASSFLAATSCLAAEPTGPAAAAVRTWFTTSSAVACTDPDGRDHRCAPGADTHFKTMAAPDGSAALVAATWTPDPTGNAESLAVALFEKTGEGWRLAREIPGVIGTPTGSASWSGGKVAFSTALPSGRKSYSVPVAATQASVKVVAKAPVMGDVYDHNGSRMAVDVRGGTIVYARPKASLAPAVTAGTVLYRGALSYHGVVAGTAYAFKTGCAPAPYAVTGRVEGKTITLKGAGPVRQGCEVTGYSETSPHAVLKFRLAEPTLEENGGDV